MHRKQVTGRLKRPRTVRLLTNAKDTHDCLAGRLPKDQARFEQRKYQPIIEATRLFDGKDLGTTEADLQEVCISYLEIYAPEKL